jgi:hypothetical protein
MRGYLQNINQDVTIGFLMIDSPPLPAKPNRPFILALTLQGFVLITRLLTDNVQAEGFNFPA